MKTKPNLLKIHKEGYIFVLIFIVATVICSMLSDFLGGVCAILTLWCIYFFRDPDKVIPSGDDLVISPADGTVTKVEKSTIPKELNMGEGEVTRISIFLNVFDIHVNRVPVSGDITKVLYHPGKFINASLDKASIHNERNHVVMKLKNGKDIVFTQIAGLIARRIVCYLEENESVSAGERYGLIRFGSRVDVYLPDGEVAQVVEGQKAIGGETILAKLGSEKPASGRIV